MKRFWFLEATYLQRVADLLDDAVLDFGFGEDTLDGRGDAFQAVHTGDQDILYSSIVEIGGHAQPVVSALLIG